MLIYKYREKCKVADYFNIILKYDRARAIIGASNLTVTPRPMLSVQGIDLHFVKYGLDPQEQALGLIAKGEKLNMETWGTEPANNSSQLTVIKQENTPNFKYSNSTWSLFFLLSTSLSSYC